jgi:hypothetical protein
MYLAFASCTLKAIHFVSLGVGKEMRPNSEKICNNNKIETQIGNVGQYRNDKKGHNAQKKKKKTVSNSSELAQCVFGGRVFSYARILANSFVQSTVIVHLDSYANTSVWNFLQSPEDNQMTNKLPNDILLYVKIEIKQT